MVDAAGAYELDDPARIEIDAEADAAAVLAQVLDGEAQPAWTGRTQHQPIGAAREILVRQRVAEHFIVDAEVFNLHAALWNTSRAAGFKDERRHSREASRYPSLHG